MSDSISRLSNIISTIPHVLNVPNNNSSVDQLSAFRNENGTEHNNRQHATSSLMYGDPPSYEEAMKGITTWRENDVSKVNGLDLSRSNDVHIPSQSQFDVLESSFHQYGFYPQNHGHNSHSEIEENKSTSQIGLVLTSLVIVLIITFVLVNK